MDTEGVRQRSCPDRKGLMHPVQVAIWDGFMRANPEVIARNDEDLSRLKIEPLSHDWDAYGIHSAGLPDVPTYQFFCSWRQYEAKKVKVYRLLYSQ